MTVQEAIDLLTKMPDKNLVMMVDCPHCGRGCQLAKIAECVLLESKAGNND